MHKNHICIDQTNTDDFVGAVLTGGRFGLGPFCPSAGLGLLPVKISGLLSLGPFMLGAGLGWDRFSWVSV